jgi:hypothetical protein
MERRILGPGGYGYALGHEAGPTSFLANSTEPALQKVKKDIISISYDQSSN